MAKGDGLVSVIIPTFNARALLPPLLESLRAQSLWPFELLVVDSSSPDGTAALARKEGVRVLTIPRESFNHGTTRTLAARLARGEFLFFLTQDARPMDHKALENLLIPLAEDPRLALSYGRQLASGDPLASLDRLFNYPPRSRKVFGQDVARLGLRAVFVSNSFACYRRKALQEVGWFPETLLAEDVLVAAKLLKRGYGIAYVAEARVWHGHRFSLHQEWRRYSLLGRFHAQNSWLLEEFGRAEGEGWRYLRFGLRFLAQRAPGLLPWFLLRTACRYLAYQYGYRQERLKSRKR